MSDDPVTDSKVIDSLMARGYLEPRRARLPRDKGVFAATWSSVPRDEQIRRAIIALQQAYGLPVTGVADDALIAFLSEAHCAVPDRPGPAGLFAGGKPWANRDVTFQFSNWPKTPSEVEVRLAFQRAFASWSQVCPLRFAEVKRKGDMRIGFASGRHDDDFPFDGLGAVLAHAFYPDWPDRLRGDVHIDTSETWSTTDDPLPGFRDLESVALHEIGHAIGLTHATDPVSIMFPNYQMARVPHQSDVVRVRALYPAV